MNYLIAYDYSADSDLALSTVTQSLAKKSDKIYVVNVIEHLQKRMSLFGSNDKMKDAQKTLEKEHQINLANLITQYQSKGIQNISGIILVSDHVGEAICKLAGEKAIDVILMGRRGMNGVKRIVVGSNSKYCIEHAPCNVMVIKKDLITEATPVEKPQGSITPQKLDTKLSSWQEHAHFVKAPNVEICHM